MDALAALAPTGEGYARLPIQDAFTWSVADGAMPAGEWYLVAFRSVRRPGADEARLTESDDRAHDEAASAEGFVHYFKGPTAADGTCLSFCLWSGRAEARRTAGRPAHREAVGLVAEMYESYTLEFHRVSRSATAAPLVFEPWDTAARPGADAVPATLQLSPNLAT